MPVIISQPFPEIKERQGFAELRQSLQNVGLVATKRAFQSSNFVTGVSGWQLTNTSFELAAGTITGGTFQTAASGKRVLINSTDNSVRLYDANNNLIVSLSSSDQATYQIFGTNIASNSQNIFGAIQVGTGYGAFLQVTNTTASAKACLYLSPSTAVPAMVFANQGSAPTYPVAGALSLIGNVLKLYDTAWRELIQDNNTTWVDLTDGGATSLHSHTPEAHKTSHESGGSDEIRAIEVASSDSLKASADDEQCGFDTTYTKKKEIKVRVRGTIKVRFEFKRNEDNGQNRDVNARIYVNGIAVGDVETTNLLTYIGGLKADLPVEPGDLIQLYAREANGDEGYCVRNFRLYWDKSSVADYIVVLN